MAYGIPVYISTLLIISTLSRIPLVYGKVTPWCGMIDYALVDRNYTTVNATKNQKLCYQACLKDSPRCKSANYRPKDQECDLNCASHYDVCGDAKFVEERGSLYTYMKSEMKGCHIHPYKTDVDVCNFANNGPSCPEDQGFEWQLVFKGVTGAGFKLYDLWTNTTWDMDSGCYGNYRNETLYSAWKNNQLIIKQVKLSLYDYTGVKVQLFFNGEDADILNWFAKERLLMSPWSDLTTEATTNYFSIDGHVLTDRAHYHDRRFYINMNYGGCEIDKGWLMVLDSEGVCPWEQSFSSYPVILYSANNTASNWPAPIDGMLGNADYLTIHIGTD